MISLSFSVKIFLYVVYFLPSIYLLNDIVIVYILTCFNNSKAEVVLVVTVM